MFDVTERVRTGLNLPDSDSVNSNYVTSTTLRVFACNEGCLIFFSPGATTLIGGCILQPSSGL